MALLTNDFVTKAGLIVQGTAAVTSSTGQTGALQVNSGFALAKNMVVGTTAVINGATSLLSTLAVTGSTTLSNALTVTGPTTHNSAVALTGTSTFTVGTGLTTLGGAATVAGTLGVTGAVTFSNTLTVTGAAIFTGSITANGGFTNNGSMTITGTNTLTVGVGATTLGGTLTVAGITSLTNTTAATAGGAGALLVTGGAYLGGNLVVNSAVAATSPTTGAVTVAGGVGIAGALYVGGSAYLSGDLYVDGTQFIVNSSTISTGDKVLALANTSTAIAATGAGLSIGTTSSPFISFLYDGASSFVSSGGIKSTGVLAVASTAAATSTTTGAVTVVGGAGIGGAVYSGADISGATVTARSLTATRLTFAGVGGTLSDNAALTWNATSSQIEGRIANANTSTNVAGGVAGSLVYQSAANTTAMLPIGTNGFVITSNGTTPQWTSLSGVSTGLATTATNIAGGLANQIPYQSGPGATVFNAGLAFNGTSLLLSGVTDSTTTATGALIVSGGVGIAKAVNIGTTLSVTGLTTVTKLAATDVTDSTTVALGSIITAGGIGVAKSIVAGGAITVGTTVASAVVPAVYSNNMILASYTSPAIVSVTPVNLDTYLAATYRTARYTIQLVDGVKVHITEITVFHDGTNVYVNEYGISTSAGELGVFSATLAAGTVTLTVTPNPTPTSMVVKVVRMGISA